jgi:hypothetical protein
MFDEMRNFCLLRKFPPEGSKHARCNERTQLAKMAFTRLGHVWGYDPFNDHLTLLAQHDPARFDPNLNGPGLPGADFITQDEESSGVIDVSRFLGSAGQQA